MKKVMLRMKKRKKVGFYKEMPKSLEYDVWYNFVTPMDWRFFKIKKSSRYVRIYEFIGDKKPLYIVSKKKFFTDVIWWVKSPPRPVNFEDVYS